MCIWQIRRCPGAGGAFCVEKRRLRSLREGRQWTCCVCGGAPKGEDGGSEDYGPLELSRGCWRSVALPGSGRRFLRGENRPCAERGVDDAYRIHCLDAGCGPRCWIPPGLPRCAWRAMPVPPSGAALILTGTRSAGHGEPSRQRAREQGVRVAEALPEMRNLSAGQTAGRVEGRGRGIWRATCIAE